MKAKRKERRPPARRTRYSAPVRAGSEIGAPELREDPVPYRVRNAAPSTALRAPSPPVGEKDGTRDAAADASPSLPSGERVGARGPTTPHSALRTPRFIDLFCGIGGFRLAFERAGGRCVFSSDWDQHSQVTYAANFGAKPHGDIHDVAVADIPKFDILCAGFPCQPFSIAGVSTKLSLGRKHGFDDVKQGNLFFDLAAIISFHQPPAFVLENVKHLQRHDQGRTFEIIYRTLTEELGYTVYHRVIDARSGVPQHRERIFLVGFKPWRDFEFPDFPQARAETRSHPPFSPVSLRHRKGVMPGGKSSCDARSRIPSRGALRRPVDEVAHPHTLQSSRPRCAGKAQF